MITNPMAMGAGRALVRARFGVSLIVVGAVLCAGCGTNGITLDEFLAMERETTDEVAQPAAASFAPRLAPYTLGAGDVLTVRVIGGQETAAPITVAARIYDDGTIDLPLVGAVAVGGLQLTAAEKAIQAAYVEKAFQEAVVHVVLEEPDTIEVLVTGTVGRPGLVALPRNQRGLIQAVAAAGGFSQAASGSVTLVRLRDPAETITMNLADPDQVRAAIALPPLQEGDMIAVAAADPNTVFVGGLVNIPGPQSYPSGVRVTVLQAIAAAAGLRTDVFPDEAVLVRHLDNGTDVRVCLDISRITDGADPNIQLTAGDILWVPHTAETRVQEWINRNIYFRAGASAGLQYNFLYNKDILNGTDEDTTVLIGN